MNPRSLQDIATSKFCLNVLYIDLTDCRDILVDLPTTILDRFYCHAIEKVFWNHNVSSVPYIAFELILQRKFINTDRSMAGLATERLIRLCGHLKEWQVLKMLEECPYILLTELGNAFPLDNWYHIIMKIKQMRFKVCK